MKKAWLIFFLMICCQFSQAQLIIALLFGKQLNTGKLEFGIVVSPALTNITGIDAEYKPGFNLGLYFNINPSRRFFLHVEGTAKGSFGARNLAPYPTGNDSLDVFFSVGKVERDIKAFGMPVLLRYAITKKFFAELGVQPDLFIKVKDVFKVDVNEHELNYTIKNTEQFTRLDFAAAGGLFYKFREDKTGMGIGIRYVRGLTDIDKSLQGTQVNNSWLATITIPVGAGAKSGANNKASSTQ
jgi:Outer membrane protein beta-barrel domain